MANPSDILTLHALGAETGADEGTGVDITLPRADALGTATTVPRTAALVRLQVLAGTVQPTVETSPDGSLWRAVGKFGPRTNTLSEELACDDLAKWLRVTWPTGTSGTFEVTVVAHQVLARRIDLYAKLDRTVCGETEQKEPGVVARALIEATDVVVGPMGAFRDIECLITCFGISAGPLGEVELTLSFEQVPLSIVGAVASIAARFVLDKHGVIGGGYDELIIDADRRAREWLLEAATKTTAPGGTPSTGSSWRWSIPTLRR